MGKTLRLREHLAARARHYITIGQPRCAAAILQQLLRLPELPAATEAEALRQLGEIHLDQRNYRAARQALRRSIRLVTTDAAAYHALARAIAADPNTDAATASRYFRRALELDPRNSLLLADAGAYFVEMGQERRGLTMLQLAAELAPDSIEALRSLVESLCELNRFDAALKEVRTAAFRFRKDARLAQIREQVEFRQARHGQRESIEAVECSPNAPAVLPFLRLVCDDSPQPVRSHYRRDRASTVRPHFARFSSQQDSGRSG